MKKKVSDIDDCESLNGLDRDICFKRKAVEQKKDSLCININDHQLRENCINRVAEEIIEGL